MCVLVIVSKAGHTPPSTYELADTRTETAPDERLLSGSVSAPAAGAGAEARSQPVGVCVCLIQVCSGMLPYLGALIGLPASRYAVLRAPSYRHEFRRASESPRLSSGRMSPHEGGGKARESPAVNPLSGEPATISLN